MIKQRKFKLFLSALLVLLLLSAWFIYQRNRARNNIFVEVKPVHYDVGWGYDILTDGKVYIHQQYIPAIPGKHGFKSAADAIKVAQKVVDKLSNRELPTLTITELKSMGVIDDSLTATH